MWTNAAKKNLSKHPMDIYSKVMVTEDHMTADISEGFGDMLLDILMFDDADLVQESLNLLVVHTSQKDLFFRAAKEMQIIHSVRTDNVFKNLTEMLRVLTSSAEMFEIWSELENEEDLSSADDVIRNLRGIKELLMRKNDDRTLGIRSSVLVDEEVQNLLRNMDAMSCFMTVQETLYDGGREELKLLVVSIMKECNDVIVWFVKNSEENQVIAFKHISWFVDRVDDGIHSSKVVRAILEGNRCKFTTIYSLLLQFCYYYYCYYHYYNNYY